MGAGQAKLSEPITLNRIRSTCQENGRPSELKNFSAQLLANDLNTLGVDIGDVKGKSADKICEVIRTAVTPDVERVCMVSSGNRGDKWGAVEKMVDMFNKNFGSRIFIHNDPNNKSRGKRKIDDVCDDLYMVADRVRGQISDHPGAVKSKLMEQLKRLEKAKTEVNRNFGSLMSNALAARGNDKVGEDLTAIKNMQKVVNSEISGQLSGARNALGVILKEYNNKVDPNGNVVQDVFLDPNRASETLKAALGDYNQIRFLDNPRAQDERVKKLVEIAQLSAPAINECQRCINKFEGVVSQTELGTQTAVKKLSDKTRSMLANVSDPYQRQEIMNCYARLINDTDSCAAGAQFAAEVEKGDSAIAKQLFGNEGGFRGLNSQLMKLTSMRNNGADWRTVYATADKPAE